MKHESKLHVFVLELLVYVDNRVKKIPVISALKIPIISPKLKLD
jgi:hypothetical protein